MKAAIIDAYGAPDVLKIKEVPKPEINDNEVLVKIKSVAVTAADSRIRGARFPKGFGFLARIFFGVIKPRINILGSTFSGVIEEVGDNVTTVRIGDEVCGMTGVRMGCYAEYIKISKPNNLVRKPMKVSHEEAAGVLFGGTAALYFIRDKLDVKNKDEVIINGASGAVGTNAVQLAKYFGANVTAVTSGSNAKIVRELGADNIIDYTKQDLAYSKKRYDVVLDTVGNISPLLAKRMLRENGRAGLMAASLGDTLRARGPVKTGAATEKKKDIEFLFSLMEQGFLRTVIDREYDFGDIVEAHEYVDSGQKTGNVILCFDQQGRLKIK